MATTGTQKTALAKMQVPGGRTLQGRPSEQDVQVDTQVTLDASADASAESGSPTQEVVDEERVGPTVPTPKSRPVQCPERGGKCCESDAEGTKEPGCCRSDRDCPSYANLPQFRFTAQLGVSIAPETARGEKGENYNDGYGNRQRCGGFEPGYRSSPLGHCGYKPPQCMDDKGSPKACCPSDYKQTTKGTCCKTDRDCPSYYPADKKDGVIVASDKADEKAGVGRRYDGDSAPQGEGGRVHGKDFKDGYGIRQHCGKGYTSGAYCGYSKNIFR